jgi:nitroreductase
MDYETVAHALSTTRSVRRRLDLERPVEPEVIEACIDVATQAPTGLNREAWRFVVITESGPKRALGDLYRRAFDALVAEWPKRAEALGLPDPPPPRPTYRLLADRLHEMPALILVCQIGVPDPADSARQVAFYGSVLPAAWSLMVALRARGIGATWTSLHLHGAADAARILGIPDGVTQTVLLPVAYTRGARLGPADRKPAREVTFWNRWGARREP